MDWIIWLIVIVAIVAVVWWLLNRNSRSGAGSSGADTGPAPGPARARLPEPAGSDASPQAPPAGAPTTARCPAGAPRHRPGRPPQPVCLPPPGSATPSRRRATAAPAEPAGRESPCRSRPQPGLRQAEWETQWSETPPAEPQTPAHHEHSHGAHDVESRAHRTRRGGGCCGGEQTHPCITPSTRRTHAPTLPGAESAAAEAAALEDEDGRTRAAAPAASRAPRAEAETAADSVRQSARHRGIASHTAEPSGHLALDQPYGEGSAAPAADGSGPEGFTVKGNASSMIYHDESSPAYDETVAEVWFVSIAHAEAAGFRPPRRSRL